MKELRSIGMNDMAQRKECEIWKGQGEAGRTREGSAREEGREEEIAGGIPLGIPVL